MRSYLSNVVNDVGLMDDILFQCNCGKYQEMLEKVLIKKCPTNYKVAMVADFLFNDFPKLPYFWGGGHEATSFEYFMGINPDWGKMEKIMFDGDNDYRIGKEFPFSLDCSGFVTWCLVNSGFDVSSYVKNGTYCLDSDDCLKMGDLFGITDNNLKNNIKIGDIAWMKGHVGIVTYICKRFNTIDVVHVSGSGKGINNTTICLTDGIIIKDELGYMPSGVEVDRVGDSYFTHIVSVNY